MTKLRSQTFKTSTNLSTQPKTRKLQQVCWHLAIDLLSTSRYQDAFVWVATACWRRVCCKLSTDLLQVDGQNLLSPGLLQVVSTNCNKSVTDWQRSTSLCAYSIPQFRVPMFRVLSKIDNSLLNEFYLKYPAERIAYSEIWSV